MKITALLLLIMGCLITAALSILFFFLFAMSFDAPGSDKDSRAWGVRLLIWLPILGLVAALIMAFIAFGAGNYVRAFRIGLVFLIPVIVAVVFMIKSQVDNQRYMRETKARELEEAKYPMQTFLRPTEYGADTIIVFPGRIVAYRIFDKTRGVQIGGPIGRLNETRDTIQLEKNPENFLNREEYEEFVNSDGKKFTEVFQFIK